MLKVVAILEPKLPSGLVVAMPVIIKDMGLQLTRRLSRYWGGRQNCLPSRLICLSIIVMLLPSCGFFGGLGKPSGSGGDSAPNVVLDKRKIEDATPRVEPKSRGGNPESYSVFGKRYKVMKSAKGFKERGDASWYGTKFHGRLTSNGERYDMYKMTAAHKNLPLPTYVQVTNLDNGKKVVVRVNDRGPFHKGRVIDLSYAAATKLGILKKGTGRVEVEAIDPRTWSKSKSSAKTIAVAKASAVVKTKAAVKPVASLTKPLVSTAKQAASSTTYGGSKAVSATNNQSTTAVYPASGTKKHYLQVAAYQSLSAAQAAQNRILDALKSRSEHVNVVIHPTEHTSPLYRVRVGPLASSTQGSQIKSSSVLQSFGKILNVYE